MTSPGRRARKPARRTRTPPDWRQFEQLVARIEETLAPKGAVVTSPDRIRDLLTGKLREVDASIRFDVGSTPILITVECRKRRNVQDDTWIEQLASKREKIGAAKTIAVSAAGFSDSATRTAKFYGIELRRLEDRIGEEIVQQFLAGFKISLIVTEYQTRTVAFELEGGAPLAPQDFGEDLAAGIKNDGLTAVLAKEAWSGLPVTVNNIMRRVDDSKIPDTGVPVTVQAVLTFAPGTVTVSTKHGPRLLQKIEVVADFTRRVVPAPATSLYEYATLEKSIQHTIEAVGAVSPTEGVRLLVDVSSPALDRSSLPPPQPPKPER
jgi:hypothetical protein